MGNSRKNNLIGLTQNVSYHLNISRGESRENWKELRSTDISQTQKECTSCLNGPIRHQHNEWGKKDM